MGRVAPQPPLSMDFSRQEYCSGVPFPSLGDLSNPGIEPGSPASQADSLLSEPPRNMFDTVIAENLTQEFSMKVGIRRRLDGSDLLNFL